MTRLSKLRSKFSEADVRRDAEGKFAPKDAALQIASKIKSKKKISDFDALVEEVFSERFNRYKNDGSYKYMILGNAQQYGDILKSQGIEAAEKAYEDHIRKTAGRIATEINNKAIAEREITAFERFYPHLKYTSTLKDFKDKNPDINLLSRLDAEEKLDKILSYDSIMARGAQHTKKLNTELRLAKDYENKLEIMEKYRSELIKNGMNEKDAVDLVKSKNIDSSIRGRDKEVTLKTATEFYQITRGAGTSTLDTFKHDEPRAYATLGRKDINIGSDAFPSIIYHEMGHHAEYEDERIASSARSWRDSRASGEQASLGGMYDASERAIAGKYISPYVGKVYPNGFTEVISMGLERFHSSRAMLKFYEQDKEHFQFIMGVIKRD
jgi:hypothetical protein